MTDEVGKSRSEEANGNVLPPIFAVVVVDTAGAGLILPLLPFYARDFGATPLTIGFLFASSPAGSQGVAMGMAQWLASLINTMAPIAGGLLIQQQNFIGWAVVLCALVMTGFAAVGLLSIFPKMSDPKER